MRKFHGLTLARAGTLESNTLVGPAGISFRSFERHDLGEPRLPTAEGAWVGPSGIAGLTKRLGGILLLAALGAAGPWRAAAVVLPATNRVAFTWNSLGAGTHYSVQSSTNLRTWTTATNTTATNVSLAFTGDKLRTFRLSANNAPLQPATLAWDPSDPSTNVTGYFIYYGTVTGTYTNRTDVGMGTNVVVSNLVAGTTYYFATTAYTSEGLESDFSNEAAWQSPLRLRLQQLP